MCATFRLAGANSLGTAFLLGRPLPNEPGRAAYVLVTARHVLSDIPEDQAILFLRTCVNGVYQKIEYPIQIRANGVPLWSQHPAADVAAMYVRLPTAADLQLLSIDMLATDQILERYEVHPGDVVSCLGFPYGAEANDAGFPILRSGQISSYPLVPTTQYPTFLFDFRVFGGNSGGPVYFTATNRTYGGATHLGETIAVVMGLVSQEQVIEEEVRSLAETRRVKHALGLAVVIAAPLIRETVDLLPPPDAS
jgi:hypothetical protein